MKKRQGQALIIVVIIIAVVMAVFANSLTTRLRYHAQEETEIYQREQALYLAEMGINKMIFKMNNNGDTSVSEPAPSGIGNYTATYYTPDDSGFGGSGYIESTGTVGEISRKVFASVQLGGGSKEAFKYCLYTAPGGTSDGASFLWNLAYHSNYNYNKNPGLLPIPDMLAYENDADKFIENPAGDTLYVDNRYNNKVVYVHMDSLDTLTVDFSGVNNNNTIGMSLMTDANSVYVTGLNGKNWSCDKKKGVNYPLIVHSGTGKFEIADSGNLTGFMYTRGYFVLDSVLTTIYGEVMENNPGGSLSLAIIWYDYDGNSNYFLYPPPHFIIGDVTKVFPGSFREEY